MLCCCERNEQTSSRIMSDYNIDLGEWGVSSVPALMAKIVVMFWKQSEGFKDSFRTETSTIAHVPVQT